MATALIPGAPVRPLRVEVHVPPPTDDARLRDASIVVTVTSTDSGAPIAGARVRALTIAAADATASTGEAGSGSGGVRAYLAAEALSDRNGQVRLDHLPRGEHWLLADAEGRARGSSHLALDAGSRAVTIPLAFASTVDVYAHDEKGAPIDGAEIEVTFGEPLPVGARTGSDGRAHVTRLGRGPYLVSTRALGYEEIVQRGVKSGERLDVTLRRLGALLVHVDGAHAGAKVQIAGAALWPARVATTNAAGDVRIGGLSAGSYALRATERDRVSPIEVGVPLERGEEKPITLALGPGEWVDVRVTDGEADDAPPLYAARVTLAEAGLSPFPFEARTDKRGHARLGPMAPGDASLAASADGFVARGAVSVPRPRDDGEAVRIALVRGGVLEGRVIDARGFPVDGASIEIIGTDFLGAPIDDDPRRASVQSAHFDVALRPAVALIPSGELGVMPGPLPSTPHAFSVSQDATGAARAASNGAGGVAAGHVVEPWVTRTDGTFRAAPVSPGRVRALVRHPQYVEALSELVTMASGGEGFVEIVMHTGGLLEGRVVDAEGRPAEGARVIIAAAKGTFERTTRVATDGTFVFASVPDALTVLVSSSDDTSASSVRTVVTVPEGGRRAISITLPASRPALDVRVVDDRGYPVDAAQLTVTSTDAAQPLRSTAFSNALGDARIAGGRGLALRVEARAPGHGSKVVKVAPDATTLTITLVASEPVHGEVRGARGGEPVANADVALYTEAGTRRVRTDKGGMFMVDDLAPGAARIHVRAPLYAAVDRDVTIEDRGGGARGRLPRIELARESVVRGTVVDGRGDPVPGARIARDRAPTYLAVGSTPPDVAITDARGRFELHELPEGSLTLEAYAPDLGRAYALGVRTFEGRETSDVRIVLTRGRDDAAAVADQKGKGGVAVTLGESGGDRAREVVLVSVLEKSEAERAGLAPGDVILEVDGVRVATIEAARARLSGPMVDDVVVTFRRGSAVDTVRVAREEVRR